MSIFSAMNGNSFTPNAFGRILVFLICSVAMLLSTSAAMGLSTGYMYEFRVASLVMAIAYALALIICLNEDWFTSRFFGGVCVVLMASLAGEFTSISLMNAMKAKSLEPLLMIPAAVFVGGLPLWFMWGRFEGWMAYLGLTLAFAVSWLFMCTLTGWGSLFGLGFAFLAIVWPAGAVSLGGALMVIPLAALGAGAAGSWEILRRN